MTRNACFYCGQDSRSIVAVGDSCGIKTCDQHKGWATRDCNAWLTKQGLVRLSDCRKHPEIRPLMDELAAGFSVLRTSGLMDEGWNLQIVTTFHYVPLLRLIEGEWHIPCCKYENDKLVPLRNFNTTDTMKNCVSRAVTALNAGIYTADYMDHMEYFQNGPDKIEETPGVTTVLYEGREVRVMTGSLT
jgi:hypothetical protein